jgi:hypothetical protein
MRARRGAFDPYEADGGEGEAEDGGVEETADSAVPAPRERERDERRSRASERTSDRGGEGRWPERARSQPSGGEPEPVTLKLGGEPGGHALSDGEAALVAFGGMPARESETGAGGTVEAEPAPRRRRGRPPKARTEAEPVES